MIAVTGFDTPEHRRQIVLHGFAGHLQKPFDPEHLVAVVGETVRMEAVRWLSRTRRRSMCYRLLNAEVIRQDYGSLTQFPFG